MVSSLALAETQSPDIGLSFFRDVMLFTEEEIGQVTEDAIQFYSVLYVVAGRWKRDLAIYPTRG